MKLKKKELIYYYYYCRGKGPKLYIWPWALFKDVDWSEDK